MEKDGALPFPDSVNWGLHVDYDYGARLLPRTLDGPDGRQRKEDRCVGVNAPLDSRRPRWLADTWDGVGDRVVVE